MPQEVAGQVAKEEEVMEKMPGVIIKNEDGSLVKVVDPNTPLPMPDVRPEPTRFDKSVHGILNGRNAAMFVNIECKKRGWDLEFEEVGFIFFLCVCTFSPRTRLMLKAQSMTGLTVILLLLVLPIVRM